MGTRHQSAELDIRKMFSSDEDDSDVPGDSDLDQLEQSTARVVTDEVEGGDVTSTTNDPNAQAQKNFNFSGVVMKEEAEDTHNALKKRPANNKRMRQSSAEDSESEAPSSVPGGKKSKMSKAKAKTRGTLEEPTNSKVELQENESNEEVSVEGNQEEEEESVSGDFLHSSRSVRTCEHELRWNNCRVSILPIHSHSWYNPCINQAWLLTQLVKIHKAKVEEEKQRVLEYSDKNLEAAEVISELTENIQDQADTIHKMKEKLNKKEDTIDKMKEVLNKKEETIAEMKENLDKKEDTIDEIQELKDGLAMKMEEDKEKHNEELELMKREMEADKEKHIKELQDMSAKVENLEKN